MARRRRAKGLPAPRWVGRLSHARRKRRSPLLLSLVVHALLGLVVVYVLSTATSHIQSMDPSMAVEFFGPLQEEPKPKPMLRRLVRAAQTSPAAPDWQRVASPTPQTIQLADRPVLTPADAAVLDIATDVDIIATAATARTDDSALSAVRTMSSKPTAGQGALTGIQRPQGANGRNLTDSTGTAAAGLPDHTGDGQGQGDTEGAGSGAGSAFRNALGRIGDNLTAGNVSGKVDVLFVIDTSGSMGDNIGAVAEHLFAMTDQLDTADIDYRLGIAAFRELGTGAYVKLSGWSMDAQTLRTRMRELGVVGNERALDALVQSLQLSTFRADADKSMVLVTDEPATTTWDAPGAEAELRERIITEATQAAIRVQVLGFRETFQRQLASASGGLFQPIPTDSAARAQAQATPTGVVLPASALDTDMRVLAGDVRRWVNPTGSDATELDVVLFVDVSRSMQGRLRATMYGISVLDNGLRLGHVAPSYTLVRFAEAYGVTGAGVQGVDISPPLGNVSAIQGSLQRPAVGDEALFDAMVRGVGAPLRKGVPAVGIIFTDEPPSGSATTGDEAVSAMQKSRLRFYAFLPYPPAGARRDGPLHALHETVRASGGKVFAMPDAHYERRRNE